MFNWKTASVEDLAKHIASVKAANTTSRINYYKDIGDEDMLNKITEARKQAKKWRALLRAKEFGLID